jgi:hypothetical protein
MDGNDPATVPHRTGLTLRAPSAPLSEQNSDSDGLLVSTAQNATRVARLAMRNRIAPFDV